MDIIWLLMAAALLPVFFAMGWFAARVDMRTVLKQAKAVPVGFYRSLDALVDRKTNLAADALSDILEKETDIGRQADSFELSLTLGKLYRQRGENDKAISVHQKLLLSPDILGERKNYVKFELGQDFQNAGLVDRAEGEFEALLDTNMGRSAREVLLNIYQQDRDWLKAIELAQELAADEQTYQFEIAQFYCELSQKSLFRSEYQEAKKYACLALNANRKCTRANIILGDIYLKENAYNDAVDAFSAIEQQNYAYLSMVGERLYDAYDALGKKEEGLSVLIGYIKTFPQLDLLPVIYDKSLLLNGEREAASLAAELVQAHPTLIGVHQLLGLEIRTLDPAYRVDADLIRSVVGRYIQKAMMYRCRHCHFKSQVFFWHCPACNKWETFTPNRIEV